MNIYLLPHKRRKYLLYSREFQTETPKQNAPEKSQDQNKFLNLIKSGYKTATAKRNRSEKLLKEMTTLSHITVYYAANLTLDKAREIYNGIIQIQIKKHQRWFIVDGALLPISAIFSIVPGPNLLLAYLAWRTLVHYKTKKGGERAVSDLEINFVKDSELEKLFEIVNKRFVLNRSARIRKIGMDLELEKLEKLY
jgi:hypothetical protein